MHQIDCPRCKNGRISAFNHVQGGVCFRCNGKGYVLVKNLPKTSVRYQAHGLWLDPENCNYNNGDWLPVFYFKAANDVEAGKKMEVHSKKVGVPFKAVQIKD